MKFIKIIIISIIFTCNFSYASADPCEDGKGLVENVVSTIVACKKGEVCSEKKLEDLKKTLGELVEFLNKSDAPPSNDCIKILEAYEAITEQLEE